MRKVLPLCIGLLWLLAASAEAQTTMRLLIVGDSWAEQQWEDGSHALVFSQNGLSDFGIYGDSTTESGSTAFDWKQASYLQLVDAALATYPDIDTVQLTVGGNDFLDVWNTGMTEVEVETLTNAILFDLGLIIDHILGQDPGVEVLVSLYDYPNFRDTLGGLGGWFACGPRHEDMGQPTPLQLNEAATGLVESISEIAGQNARTHFVDHFSLMQNHYGLPGMPPGSIEPPGDINEPSPVEAMREHFFGLATDCFHLKPEGYEVIVQNLIDQFLAARMNGQAAVELADLQHTYNGTPVTAQASTEPSGLIHSLSYDGQVQPPVDAGSYLVEATVDQPGWNGQASGTLIIEPAEQTIAFDLPTALPTDHPPITLNANADSGLAVEFTVISGPATLDQATLVLDGQPGTVVVEASQPGNSNWLSAGPVTQSIEILGDELFRDAFLSPD
ncbi:MAG: MBG domain-containing protein [Xanthomonadales bacterium]|nr:MBG domain-containing protein [Xanthomonadales bacterium]